MMGWREIHGTRKASQFLGHATASVARLDLSSLLLDLFPETKQECMTRLLLSAIKSFEYFIEKNVHFSSNTFTYHQGQLTKWRI